MRYMCSEYGWIMIYGYDDMIENVIFTKWRLDDVTAEWSHEKSQVHNFISWEMYYGKLKNMDNEIEEILRLQKCTERNK